MIRKYVPFICLMVVLSCTWAQASSDDLYGRFKVYRTECTELSLTLYEYQLADEFRVISKLCKASDKYAAVLHHYVALEEIITISNEPEVLATCQEHLIKDSKREILTMKLLDIENASILATKSTNPKTKRHAKNLVLLLEELHVHFESMSDVKYYDQLKSKAPVSEDNP